MKSYELTYRLLSLFLSCCLAIALSAQAPSFRFTHLTTAEGLSDNWVHAAMMDSRGFMWFATNDALSRYDGRHFKHYRQIPNDTTSIKGHNMMDLLEDPHGKIWIASIGGGLSCFDPITETFKNYSYPVANTFIERNSAVSLLLDAEHQLWVGTYDSGLHLFDQDKESFIRIDLQPNVSNHAEAFRLNSVNQILEDISHPEWLWLAGNNGLHRFDKRSAQVDYLPYPLANGQKDTLSAAMTLFADQANELWIGTWGRGLAQYLPEQKQWNYYYPNNTPEALADPFANVIKGIGRKSAQELWVCSHDQGLLIFNTETKRFQAIRHQPADPFSIGSNQLDGLYTDPQRRNWFFHFREGISILDPANQVFSLREWPHQSLCPEAPFADVVDLLVDHQRGLTYLTTTGCEGLFVLDDQENLVHHTSLGPSQPGDLNVFHLYLAPDGQLWAAGGYEQSADPSLWTYGPATKALKAFEHPQLEDVPIHQYRLTDILGDQEGRIWLATKFGGLIKIDPRTKELKQYLKSPNQSQYIDPGIHIHELLLGQNGHIWLATLEDGVYTFDPEKEVFRHYPPAHSQKAGLVDKRIMTLAEDHKGHIWVGTSDNGIELIDPQKKTNIPVGQFRLQDGLPSEKIWRIVQDQQNDLWIATNRGLCRYDYEDGHFIQYNQKDGLKDLFLQDKGMRISSRGELLLGQQNGFYRFHPQALYQQSTPPPLAFTGFKLFEKDWPLAKDLNFIDQIQLAYHQNFFSIGFAALNYTQAEKNRYAYQLEGYDSDWIYPADQRSYAAYTKVSPGTYTFRLRGANNENKWNPSEIQLLIEVLPPPWQTWWAYSLYVLLIG
ncbi:MAG: two-component regulator propeller domain-containing protein, partial [Bacteroidota bacterium]